MGFHFPDAVVLYSSGAGEHLQEAGLLSGKIKVYLFRLWLQSQPFSCSISEQLKHAVLYFLKFFLMGQSPEIGSFAYSTVSGI